MSNAPDELLTELLNWETRVWQALVHGDGGADAKALHDSFLGVYPDGFASKEDHLAQLHDGPTIQQFTLSDCRTRALGPDHAVLSYRAEFLRTGRTAGEAMYVTSIWQTDGDGWVNIFSQDTPAIS